jgi:hypothetical protein
MILILMRYRTLLKFSKFRTLSKAKKCVNYFVTSSLNLTNLSDLTLKSGSISGSDPLNPSPIIWHGTYLKSGQMILENDRLYLLFLISECILLGVGHIAKESIRAAQNTGLYPSPVDESQTTDLPCPSLEGMPIA